jgi:hypothetical protein
MVDNATKNVDVKFATKVEEFGDGLDELELL